MRKPPTPSNDHEADAPKPRDRHGERSVPPPLTFDIYELPDSTLLTSRDVAAHGRWAVSTVETWRLQPDHPLRWLSLPGGARRTTVGYLKAFLASGTPRKRPGPKPRAAPTEPPPIKASRKASRRRAAEAAELQEQT
jgi:hypothetical protein